MKTINNRCVALGGSVGKQVTCLIYENRPLGCQKFQPGSDLCKEARVAANLPI